MKNKCEFCGKEYGTFLSYFKMHYSLTKNNFCLCEKCRNEYGKEIKRITDEGLGEKELGQFYEFDSQHATWLISMLILFINANTKDNIILCILVNFGIIIINILLLRHYSRCFSLRYQIDYILYRVKGLKL